jgi:hypothetical protein
MPIVGTSARLYFPSETSEEPIITGCVRTNGSSCGKTADTTNRYFGTEHGSEIEMTPGAVNIKGGSKEPLSISFDDKVGVTLKSPKNLNLNADDDIIIKTPASVKVKAQSQIGVTKAGAENGFSVETDMHFIGGSVIKEGSDREAFSPFDDEPKAGTKPDPPPPPKEEKKGFNWGKLLVAAVVAVAVVASVLTFGLGATLAVAAVGAIVACAAVGAVEGAKNSIDSQLSQNGGDSSKINYAEVAKASFFGAATGAKDMAVTEACAAYDTLNQTASFMFDVCTLGYYHNSCKDFSEWSHKFLKEKAPYKEGFEDAEFVLNVALLADGVNSIVNIGRNLPGKFSIGEISLAEMGVRIPVLCVDGSVAIARVGDVAAITAAGGAMYNATSTGGSEGKADNKNLGDEVAGKTEPKKKSIPDFVKKQWEAGNKFNKENRPRYPYNEVELESKVINGKKYVVDSYVPGKEIISRKFTQLAEVQEKTALSYLSEFTKKYSSGSEISAGRFNPNALKGGRLEGELILEVPVQTKPVPQIIIDEATKKEIIIRDITGKVYN